MMSKLSTTPEHIISDIGRKFASDVSASALRNFRLVDDAKAQFVVGTFGAAAAIGMTAAAYVQASGGQGSAEQMVDALWAFIRPMALETVADALNECDEIEDEFSDLARERAVLASVGSEGL